MILIGCFIGAAIGVLIARIVGPYFLHGVER